MNYEPEDMNNEEIERADKLSGSQVRAIGILLRTVRPDLMCRGWVMER